MSGFPESSPKGPVRPPLQFLNSHVPSRSSLTSHHFQISATLSTIPTPHSVTLSVGQKEMIKGEAAKATMQCLPLFVHPREAFYSGHAQETQLNQTEQSQEDKPCLWTQQFWQNSTTVLSFFLDSLNQRQEHSFAFFRQDHLLSVFASLQPLSAETANTQHGLDLLKGSLGSLLLIVRVTPALLEEKNNQANKQKMQTPNQHHNKPPETNKKQPNKQKIKNINKNPQQTWTNTHTLLKPVFKMLTGNVTISSLYSQGFLTSFLTVDS